jgi:hypothetical protein
METHLQCSALWVNRLSGRVSSHSGMKIKVFGDVRPCSFVNIYERFRGTYHLPLQGYILFLNMEVAYSSETLVNVYLSNYKAPHLRRPNIDIRFMV